MWRGCWQRKTLTMCRVRARGVLLMAHMTLVSTLVTTPVTAEDLSLDDELSFFDYLGTMVDADGQWLDPLELAEQGALDASADTAQDAEQADQTQEAEDAQ